MSADKQVICVGEAMVEFNRGKDGRFGLSCGGDSFNTAVYLARKGMNVAFATALGDDPFSEGLVALASAEGISRELILRAPGRLPAITAIDLSPSGDRRYFHWREGSPARDLFELPDWSKVAEAMVGARMVYFTGITLSLYSNVGLGRFFAALEMARKQGAKVAFDCNFRPRGWKGDLGRTRLVFMEALKRIDIALPTYDDEAVLWGDPSPEATVERMRAFGIAEIVVKNGPNSALIANTQGAEHIPVPDVVQPVDTTAAGDAFNAGYLAARLAGEPAATAAGAGHRMAAQVISHVGGLIPRTGEAVH
jgi:2-dehydro-3-deoxygluconokinase